MENLGCNALSFGVDKTNLAWSFPDKLQEDVQWQGEKPKCRGKSESFQMANTRAEFSKFLRLLQAEQ